MSELLFGVVGAAAMLASVPPATASAATVCTHVGGSSHCPWDELHFSCSPSVLAVEYNISAYSGVVNCGSLFLESDIGGGINVPPLVSLPAGGAQADKYYTLIMVDPDADMNGSFPIATAPGPHAPVRHWVVGNILGSELMAGSPFNATTVSPFHGPSPPSGSHRYGLFVFYQPNGFINFTALTTPIINWNYSTFIDTHSLGAPMYANWHVTLHSE